MDFLNKSIDQVSELFRSLTPGARITAGLLLAVVVGSAGHLFRQGTAGPDAYLFGGEPLPDSQLTIAEAAIAQAGLSSYQREGNRIRVPAGQQAAYLAAVADAGALPPNFNTILERALDKGGPWESREATRERLKIAKQQTLSEIIRAMYWVENAVVLYDEQQSRGPRNLEVTKQVTASVNVQPILGESLDPQRARMLQKLVAHAVNMKAEDVAVTNLGEGDGVGSDSDISPLMFADDYYQTKIAFEMQKKDSIRNALHDIPGVRVEVNAELDDTMEEMTRNVKPDPKPALRQEVETTEASTEAAAAPTGRPGVTVQGPNRQAANEALTQQNKNESQSGPLETENDMSVEKNRVLRKSYTPKEVWATVTIPGSYIESLWKRRNPDSTDPPKPQDLQVVQDDVVLKVENIVEPLLLLQANKGQDTCKHVRVVVLDSLPAPPIEPPSLASHALAWTGRYWSTLAMIGVAMFSLLVLRSVVKGGPASGGATAAVPPLALTLHTKEAPAARVESEEESPDDRPRLRLKMGKGNSLKDDLVEIVREDPDAAADILRSWIGKAS